MGEDGWENTTAARPDAWAEVLVASRRLDRAPLRRLVNAVLWAGSPLLRGLDPTAVSTEPLRGWRRLGEALTGELCGPLDAYVAALDASDLGALLAGEVAPGSTTPAADLSWEHRADGAVRSLVDLIPRDHPDHHLLSGLVLSFCYLECIVFWEYTTDHDALGAVLGAIRRQAALRLSDGGSDDRAIRLLEGVDLAAEALATQFAVEEAWSCVCPISVTRAAEDAVGALLAAKTVLGRAVADDPASDTRTLELRRARVALLDGIEAVVGETVEDAHLYVGLLHRHIGPAATEFAENLDQRLDPVAVVEALRRARTALDDVLDPTTGTTIMGVQRSEARAQGRSIDAMLDILGRDEKVPGDTGTATLLVDRGELHYLFPFALPVDGSGKDFVQKALTDHLAGEARATVATRPRLADRLVTIEDSLQTEVFSHASVAYDADAVSSGATLTFGDDRLTLETAAGVRYCDIGIEVLLGPLNNHMVHITVTTDIVPMWCTVDDEPDDELPAVTPGCPGGFLPLSTAWTPHELDQFIHRGGTDFGSEQVFFLGEREDAAPGAHHHPEQAWPSFLALAATIVNDLHVEVARYARLRNLAIPDPTAREEPGADAPGQPDRQSRALTVDERSSLLRQQSHVVVIVTSALAVRGDERAPLQSAAELAACRGAAALFAPQPPAPRALEEWTTLPAFDARELVREPGIVGSAESLIRCHGDTTLMFAPWSPNWQVMEDRDLTFFALSLGSPYQLGRDRLLASAALAAQLDTSEDLVHLKRRQLDERARRISTTERRLNDQISFADELTGHARSAAVIRPRRDRSLLDHVSRSSGVLDLQGAMAETRQIGADRLDDLRDMMARVAEAETRRGQAWVERILLLVAVLAFVDVFWWFYDINHDDPDWGWNWNQYFELSLGGLLFVAAALAIVVFRRRRRSVAVDDGP